MHAGVLKPTEFLYKKVFPMAHMGVSGKERTNCPRSGHGICVLDKCRQLCKKERSRLMFRSHRERRWLLCWVVRKVGAQFWMEENMSTFPTTQENTTFSLLKIHSSITPWGSCNFKVVSDHFKGWKQIESFWFCHLTIIGLFVLNFVKEIPISLIVTFVLRKAGKTPSFDNLNVFP